MKNLKDRSLQEEIRLREFNKEVLELCEKFDKAALAKEVLLLNDENEKLRDLCILHNIDIKKKQKRRGDYYDKNFIENDRA